MAAPRVEIPEVVLSGGQPVTGASVQVNNRGAGSATVFAAEVGGTTAANPIITDANGRIEGWLEEGSYDLVVSATGLTTYTQPYEAVRGNNSPGKLGTATGDIFYASSANNIARLGIGATGNALVVSGGIPSWGSVSAVTYRKTVAKPVNTTVSATDLLNAEITLAALSATSVVRLTASGDWLQNSGGAAAVPRFQLLLGGVTLLDTGVSGTATNSATRAFWSLGAEISNLGATNSQSTHMVFRSLYNQTTATSNAFTTGEGGYATFLPGTGSFSLLIGEGVNPSTAANTALSAALVLNVINGSASASYETKLTNALVEIL